MLKDLHFTQLLHIIITLLIAILYPRVMFYEQLLSARPLRIATDSWVLVTYTDILSR